MTSTRPTLLSLSALLFVGALASCDSEPVDGEPIDADRIAAEPAGDDPADADQFTAPPADNSQPVFPRATSNASKLDYTRLRFPRCSGCPRKTQTSGMSASRCW